jgi:hypothetical protein
VLQAERHAAADDDAGKKNAQPAAAHAIIYEANATP